MDGKVKIKLLNGVVYTCLYDGQLLSTSPDYDLECPDLSAFCTKWSFRCPMDCHGNGVCLIGNRCFCLDGWSGQDCSISLNRALRTDDIFVLSGNHGGGNRLDFSEAIAERILGSLLTARSAILFFAAFVLYNVI